MSSKQTQRSMFCGPRMKYKLHHPVTDSELNNLHLEPLPFLPTDTSYPMTQRSRAIMDRKRLLQERTKREINQERIRKTLSNAESLQHRFLINKLSLLCHANERQQKQEMRRRQMAHKLETELKINLNQMKKEAADRIVVMAEAMERSSKANKRKEIEKRIAMIEKLLQEQKKKCREKKSLFKLPAKERKEEITLMDNREVGEEWQDLTELECEAEVEAEADLIPSKSEEATIPTQNVPKDKKKDKTEKDKSEGVGTQAKKDQKDKKKAKEPPAPIIYPTFGTLRTEKVPPKNVLTCKLKSDMEDMEAITKDKKAIFRSPRETKTETRLNSLPSSVVFKNLVPGKSYHQEMKITNTGRDKIHCRYAGAHIDEFGGDSTVIKADIVDSVVLWPGLSFSIKIQFRSDRIVDDMKGRLIFETKRRDENESRQFHVPVLCVPPRAAVTVKPLKIKFPCLSWCKATCPKDSQLLRKTLKLENKGGKGCVCRIARESLQDPERQNMNEEEFFIAILKELLDNVCGTFQFDRKYFIEIPPFDSVEVHVLFFPKHKGLHHEVRYVQFEDCHHLQEEKIELMGDIKTAPIYAEPCTINLKTCIINSGVYQGTFQIFNNGAVSCPVQLTLPGSLKSHSHVFPSSSVVQPCQSATFSVKFYPRVSITEDASRYYDPENHLLNFPVFIRPATADFCWADHIQIYVSAILTGYELELNPCEIDFGTVTTLETAHAEITLTNNSLAMQEYGFVQLQEGVRVEPNCGFGTILPGETIPLHILYSPTPNMIKGNTVGLPGQQGGHKFDISVTTIAELGGFGEKLPQKKEQDMILNESEGLNPPDTPEENSLIAPEDASMSQTELEPESRTESIEGELDLQENKSERIRKKEATIREYLNKIGDEPSEYSFFERVKSSHAELENVPDDETEPLTLANAFRQEKHVIRCRAFIKDPLCELSATVIRLPATPFFSFSLTRFHINGENRTTMPKCFCGLLERLQQEKDHVCQGRPRFDAWFQFQCDCPFITLEPQVGHFKHGESVAITIIFRPELPPEHIRHESRFTKAEKLSEERKKETSKGKSAQTAKPAAKKGKTEVLDEPVDASKLKLEKLDYYPGERKAQERFEEFLTEAQVHCLIKITECNGGTERTEVHKLKINGLAIPPAFVHLGESQEINFGKVAVGTRPKIAVEVKNTALEKISPSLSIFNPVGPFWCPLANKQLQVEPGQVWRQPITFAPVTPGVETEFFEIRYGPTVLQMVVKGEGVEPQYSFKPEFACNRMEAKKGATAEVKVDFENACSAPLNLLIVTDFMREGFDVPCEDKSSPTKDKKPTGKKVQKMLTELTPEVLTELEEFMEDVDSSCSGIFTVFGLDVNNRTVVPPFGKISFKLRFCPPAAGAKSEVNPGLEAAREIPEKKYAVRYNVLLGGIIPIQGWLLFGSISKDKKK